MKKSQTTYKNKGFSLVELVIVISVIAILAAVIGIFVIRYIEKGRQAKDVYNANLIKDAINTYPFPSDFQGRDVYYTDPDTGEKEHYKRGWVYVDKDEIRCSDQSTALAMIQAGLVYVSPEMEETLKDNEEDSNKWFPTESTGDYYRKSKISEYCFKNELHVLARRTWNTYQIDVYIDEGGELHLGASASNEERTSEAGHQKDSKTADLFAKKLGFADAKITPIGNQNSD